MKETVIYQSPVGPLRLDCEDGAVIALKKAEAGTVSGPGADGAGVPAAG